MPSSMPSDFLAVEFICLISALRRIHISSSIGCRRLDKLDRKQSNVTYVERRKMSLDNVRRQSDARCAPHLGKSPRVDILKGFHHVATGTTKLIRATALSRPVCTEKLKPGRNDGEARRVSGVNE